MEEFTKTLNAIIEAASGLNKYLDTQSLHQFSDHVTGNGRPKKGDDFVFPGVYVLIRG